MIIIIIILATNNDRTHMNYMNIYVIYTDC